jgi:hypothetical protein
MIRFGKKFAVVAILLCLVLIYMDWKALQN